MAEKVDGGRVMRTVTIKFVDMEQWLRFKEIAMAQMRKQGQVKSLYEYFNDVLGIHNKKRGNI